MHFTAGKCTSGIKNRGGARCSVPVHRVSIKRSGIPYADQKCEAQALTDIRLSTASYILCAIYGLFIV